MKKLLIIALFGSAILFACKQNKPAAPQAATQPPAPTATAGLTWAGDSDPVCGMHVDQSAEDTVHYNGKIYGFCGPNCKAEFVKDPSQYAK